MRKKQTKLIKSKAGITLIALIITVIVMLILAGVAINLTIGDNGIFRKSDEGAQIYKNATNNEAESLNSVEQEMGDLINQYNGGGTSTDNPSPTLPTEKPGKPDESGIYTENSTINGGSSSAFNPEIPKGFKPVDIEEDGTVWGDGTTPPTQDSVKKGLVIEDEEGNQFVWIAVDGQTVKLDRYTFAEDGTETAQGEAVIDSYWQELASSDKGNIVAKDINAFKTSVAEHGGYYLARYEASYGTDGKPNSKVSVGTPIEVHGEENAPTQEGLLWNNITQPNAANACRNMYDSSYGVTSDLMNSYAWDTAIVFIQKYSEATNYSRQTSLNTTLANTGTNNDEKCHIQDMASNCGEWTTETSSRANIPCTVRGGYYCGRSSGYTSKHFNNRTSDVYCYCSFRALLYL